MSILPFPSFLDDVKEKGFRKAIFEGIDNTVERITAGMNIQDIREALRGENPSRRPNPRLQPHADGFWLHMRPSYYHKAVTGVYPTFRLGWLSVYFVFFETITGLLLMLWYTPSPEIAYGNMLNILSNVPFGQFMRDLHRLGAEAMVIIVALHMMRTWITGSYKKPRQFTWFTGLLLLVFTGLLSFTGYLLPWDQLSLWAVTIGASMAEATPVVGEQVNLLLRGAPELGANGLLRFYLGHVLLLPAFLFIFTGVHYYKVIIHGHSLPPQEENIGEDTAKRVPLDRRVYFIPDILTNEIMWIGVTTFILVVLVMFFYQAPLENHADPQNTPLGTTAPWYFLWIQGALKLGDKFITGIVFPTVALGALAVIPYLDVTPSRRYSHRRWMLTFAFLLISVTTILSYMGLPEFAVRTSAEIEIIHELTFEPAHSHVGKMRTVPYDQLVVGAYTTTQFEVEPGEEPQQLLNAFNEAIALNGQKDQMIDRLNNTDHLDTTTLPQTNLFRVVPDSAPVLEEVLHELYERLEAEHLELPNAWGAIIITPNQDGLRRIDLAISWDTIVLEAGKPVLDENGDPLFIYETEPVMVQAFDDNGQPVVDADGNPVMVEQTTAVVDADGNPVLDKDGNPVMETVMQPVVDEDGNPVVRRSIYTGHIYLHKDSAYFD